MRSWFRGGCRSSTCVSRIKFLFVVLFLTVITFCAATSEASDNLDLSLNFLLVSEHHGETDTTNENHKGIGLSLSPHPRVSVGVMNYTNSYDNNSTLLYVHTTYGCLSEVCFGVGGGYVSGYGDKLSQPLGIPLIAYGTVRWKYFVINFVPTEITALALTFPLQ